MKQTYNDWYSEVVYNIEMRLQCTTSDAQGFLDAHDFYLTQAWGKWLTAIEAAKYVDEKSQVQ